MKVEYALFSSFYWFVSSSPATDIVGYRLSTLLYLTIWLPTLEIGMLTAFQQLESNPSSQYMEVNKYS